MALSDGGSNQTYVYIGAKQTDGSPVRRAGLAGGRIFSLLVPGVAAEDRNNNIGITKSIVGKGAGKAPGASHSKLRVPGSLGANQSALK